MNQPPRPPHQSRHQFPHQPPHPYFRDQPLPRYSGGNNYPYGGYPQPIQPPDQPARAPHGRFRWWLLTVPFAAIAAFWLISGMHASFDFADVMETVGTVFEHRMARLAALGVLLIAITLIVRIALHRHDRS